MLTEEIKNIRETTADLRKFGITIGSVLIIIAAALYFYEKSSFMYFGGVGFLLIVTGLAAPGILKPLNKIWMTFALLLGWLTSRIILILLYYLVITPIGIIAKLFGKKFLDLNISKDSSTYWIKREKTKFTKDEYEKQF